jgi:hypothetical protein
VPRSDCHASRGTRSTCPLASRTTYPPGIRSARQGAGKRRDASGMVAAYHSSRIRRAGEGADTRCHAGARPSDPVRLVRDGRLGRGRTGFIGVSQVLARLDFVAVGRAILKTWKHHRRAPCRAAAPFHSGQQV